MGSVEAMLRIDGSENIEDEPVDRVMIEEPMSKTLALQKTLGRMREQNPGRTSGPRTKAPLYKPLKRESLNSNSFLAK